MASSVKRPSASVVVAGRATVGAPFTPRVAENGSNQTEDFFRGAPVEALTTRPVMTAFSCVCAKAVTANRIRVRRIAYTLAFYAPTGCVRNRRLGRRGEGVRQFRRGGPGSDAGRRARRMAGSGGHRRKRAPPGRGKPG